MVKKFWVLMLVFSILSIGPANAVQIESLNLLNINGTISDKNLENNDIVLDDNITTILTDNNTTKTNKTVINGTIDTENVDLNETKGNNTNETEINETAVLNKTISNDTNKTEDIFNTKAAVIGTLAAVATISAVFTPFLLQATIAAFPDPTLLTKGLAIVCGIATFACASCTLGCTVAAIFCWWLL